MKTTEHYEKDQDLPASVREELPPEKLTAYREAFNGAWNEYSHDEEFNTINIGTRHEYAHRKAMATVQGGREKSENQNPAPDRRSK